MASIAQMIDVERRMRELLTREALPEPDEVHYRETSVALLWHETKTVVIVDIDDEREEAPLDP